MEVSILSRGENDVAKPKQHHSSLMKRANILSYAPRVESDFQSWVDVCRVAGRGRRGAAE